MPVEQASMNRIVGGLSTKSAKIRALAKAGYARADIARFLDIRYQHVRNVLTQNAPRSEMAARSELHEASKVAAEDWPVDAARADVLAQPDGSLKIDADFALAAEIRPGDAVLLRVVDGEIRLSGYRASLRRAQSIAERFRQPGRSEVDDFIAERRALGARGD